ncbi:MAG: nucleoside recognition domain-containing protein [Dehalococcoidia bacterium]|nr:nucleoside recognition domain-containing protein [Dehalococcoidia bacterium]
MSAIRNAPLQYDRHIESALSQIGELLKREYGLSKRTVGLLLLQTDTDIEKLVQKHEAEALPSIRKIVDETRSLYNQPLNYVIAMRRQQEATRLSSIVTTSRGKSGTGFTERLSRITMHPVTGSLILLAVLYLGLYQFVGVFGAGTLVDFFENTVFGQWINPWITGVAIRFIPFQWLRALFVGDYGIITLGLSYTVAIILPIVTTFFIVFSIIEDSGYLPRLSMLIDRIFKTIGLSGRAVIPIVLGLGCDTMATIVTRTQETKRERVITTLLLALAIPCSAQLGVIFAILSDSKLALVIWVLVVMLIMLLVGFLTSRILPGEKATFYMEIPPLRLPKISNVLVKTLTRLQWYLTEVIPFFIIASVMLWLGELTGVFNWIIALLKPVVAFIGLPQEAAQVFLYGFFRRDFGAAGLYDLHNSGAIVGIPLVVAAVTLTLFIPCIAQFMVMLKERGVKTALAIAIFIFPFAFVVGYFLNLVLTTLRVTL